MGSYSKMQYPCVFGHQCPFQQMQVVGVYFFFGRADRIGPASQRRDDGFHFQVAAFHQTHLDRSTAFCHTCFGKFDQFGLKGLAMWENGFRNVTTNNTPVNTVADLKGLKLRTMENSIHLAAWKAMGANPTPMAFSELYTAMQQGTVDGEENPLGIITGNGFEEVEKYCTLTEHVYTPYYVVMNADKYNSLSADQQAAIEKAMAEATTYQYEQSNKYEEESIDTMEAAGCTVTALDEAAKLEFKAAADSGDGLSLAKEQMDNPDLADKMVEELEAYRK